MKTLGLILGLLVAGSLTASAADVSIGTNGATGTRDCSGGAATIDGNRAHLTLQNCRTVTINGNSNTVDAGAPESLTLMGNRNDITWRAAADGRRPKVSNVGTRNTVTEATAGAAAPSASSSRPQGAAAAKPAEKAPATSGGKVGSGGAKSSGAVVAGGNGNAAGLGGLAALGALAGNGGLTVSASGEHRTYDCNGLGALISGHDNDLVLQNCSDLTASGNGNKIRIASPQSIVVSGDHNQVQWTGAGRPKILSSGQQNSVEQAH